MRRAFLVAAAFVFLLGGVGWWWFARTTHARNPAQVRLERRQVNLTVYAQDFALVQEVRPVQLRKGVNHLTLMEVSRHLDPQSLLVHFPTHEPELVAIAYNLGIPNQATLLRRYLGETVEIVRYGETGREAGRQSGTLMSTGSDLFVLVDGKLVVNPPGTLMVPYRPDIALFPQLAVKVHAPADNRTQLTLTYLTRGLRWSADYVATLTEPNAMRLECWGTVTNETGVSYPNAKVVLVAGTPSRAVRTAKMRLSTELYAERRAAQAVPLTLPAEVEMRATELPQPTGDFHAYPIKRRVTIYEAQVNRLLMFASHKVPVIKDYAYRAPSLPHYSSWVYGLMDDDPIRGTVQVSLTFWNRKQDGLGVPLPAGVIRVYEPDKTGTLRYLGAAEIPSTPTNKKVNVTLANAFDVFAEWKRVSLKRLGRKIRYEVEITLHNEKPHDVTIRVVQPFETRWNIVATSQKFVKLDAFTAQWSVPVKAGEVRKVTFTAELAW